MQAVESRSSGNGISSGKSQSVSFAAVLETLEQRTLLAAAPVFATPLYDGYWLDGTLGRSIGIDAFDEDGDALTITAVSDNPLLTVSMPAANRYARMNYTYADGTVIGSIVVQLFEDMAPLATQRFITLSTMRVKNGAAVAGTPFYTNVPVHRVIDGFMMQTGDAVNGNGTGGSGLGVFNNEVSETLSFAGKGVLAMANSGANTNDAQFFITDAETDWLNGSYSVFGQVVSGWDTLDAVLAMPTDGNDRPYEVPLLASVDIFESSQLGVVRLVADETFAGEATVTITLDDGNGNQTVETITVKPRTELEADLGNSPVITAPSLATATAGQNTVINVSGVDDNAQPIKWAAHVQYANVSLVADVVDNDDGTLTITVPENYSGLATVTLWAWEDIGWADVPTAVTTFPLMISRPQTPLEDLQNLGGVPAGASVEKSVIVGDRLYVALGNSGLGVYDVSDPANVTLLGSYNTAGYARDVAVSGNTALVALGTSQPSGLDTHNGLVALDVSDPTNMVLLDSVENSSDVGLAQPLPHLALEVKIEGNLAYVVEWANYYYENTAGLVIYDISDPANLQKVANLENPLVNDGFAALEMKDGYVLASDFAGVIHAIDVRTPASPVWLSYTILNGSPWGMDLVGDRLYVSTNTGLEVFNAANPRKIKRLGWTTLGGSPFTVVVVNQTAVVGTQNGFQFVDVSNPKRMGVEFEFVGEGGTGAAVLGDLVVLGVPSQGLLTMDADQLVRRVTVHTRSTILSDGAVPVTVSVGRGVAYAYTTGAGTGDIERLEVPGSAASLKLTTPKGQVASVGDIMVGGSINVLDARGVTVEGDVTVAGWAKKVMLGDTGDAAGTIQTISLGGSENAKAATVLMLGSVDGLKIDSDVGLRQLKVVQWLDSGGDNDVVTAPWVGSVMSAGDFEADLDLSGAGAAKFALTKAVIAGDLKSALWDIGGSAGVLNIRGWANASQVRTAGSINGIVLGGTTASDFLAGVKAVGDGGPARKAAAMADYQTMQRIGNVKITGIKGQDKTSDWTLDSNFSAASFGAVNLLNCATPSGVFACSDGSGKEIAKVNYRSLADGTKWLWKPTSIPADMGNVTVDILDA